MSLSEQWIIWLVLGFGFYHTIRDLFQDILHIHNPLVDVFHRKAHRGGVIFGRSSHYWGLPLTITMFLLALYSLRHDQFGTSGAVALGLFITFMAIWIYSTY